MTDPTWGLLGPSELSSTRRARTLGVAVAVRSFNDLAVPGMGNVWFGKQIFLASLGVAVATRAANPRYRNIQVTNAVEALACWIDLTDRGWEPDPRLRGSRKMDGKPVPSFKTAASRGFYVSQPMRAASIQPLLALGLVESSQARFNSFELSAVGRHFVDLVVSGHRPDKLEIVSFLARWANGSTRALNSPSLACIRPTDAMPAEARERLIALMVAREPTGSWIRRKAVIDWLDANLDANKDPKLTWSHRPQGFTSDHWADLYLGSLFFRTRDSALRLLERIEARVAGTSTHRVGIRTLATEMHAPIAQLRLLAGQFLQPQPAWFRGELGPSRLRESVSTLFCQECSDPTDVGLLSALLQRDERVLRLRDDHVVPGPAFLDGTASDGDPEDIGTDLPPSLNDLMDAPSGISPRILSMFLLHRDLRGRDPVAAA